MEPINYYTTLSSETERQIGTLDRPAKLLLLMVIIDGLVVGQQSKQSLLTMRSFTEIQRLSPNESLGLIKALADQCQETLISK